MNPKMKSAIEKITLNDATFSNEVIEPTYVNFFYGKNGAGKSTIARTFKANDERLQWQAGKASTDYDVLVYDTDFINANLRNYGNLAGVFTVNETNIAIQEQVDTLNAERKKMGEEYNGHKAAIDQKTADKNTALSTFQSDCWSKSAEARTLFDEAIKGKKKAALFAQEILAITPVAHDVEDLKTLYGTVFSGDAQQYNMLSKAGKVTYASLPGYELMGKPISSSSDTDFAKFIKALKATDWVRSGHTHFAGQTDGKCPYCQQKLPSNFDKEIAACFDAQYQDDISAINAFQRTYESEMDVVVKAMLQIRDILMKSDKLKTSAKNNTQQDFEFSYFDDIDDALIEGLSQNQDFFSMLLSNDEMKHQVMGIFSDEIYKSLRESV